MSGEEEEEMGSCLLQRESVENEVESPGTRSTWNE